MSDADLFLDVARRIGKRIVRQARWSNGSCTWEVVTVDRSEPYSRRGTTATASGALYQGTAGIALFLMELYRTTCEPEVARTAEGAVRHAIAEADQLPACSFGFYNGRVGIAYAAARAGVVLQQPAYSAHADAILTALRGREHEDYGLDVIAGAAGAIPALVELADTLGGNLALDLATALGDHLVNVANREPLGWCWGRGAVSYHVRHLTGLAHGAAGVGHGLLALHQATGVGKYRYAAEQAFFYERQFFEPDQANWLNLQNSELAEYTLRGRVDELKALLARSEEPPPYSRTCALSWCHGAPGIALARLRAYELLGDSSYETEARAAVRTTLGSIGGSDTNYSLCHGSGGNCEALLYGAEVLGDASLREAAEACGLRGWELYEEAGRSWRCGTIGGLPDPSLMLGEAGIGYFYLRLSGPDTPSVLLLRERRDQERVTWDSRSYEELQSRYVQQYFGRTLRILEHLDGRQINPVRQPSRAPSGASDITAAHEAICASIEGVETPGVREQLWDGSLPERVRYELALSPIDFTELFLAALTRPESGTIQWDKVAVQLSPGVRLVECRWDWDQWLTDSAPPDSHGLPSTPVLYVVHQSGDRVDMRRLDLLSGLVLDAVQKPARLTQIFSSVRDHLPAFSKPTPTGLRQSVVAQLEEAHHAGLVDCLPVGTG